MKKINITLFAVLFASVAALFVLHFIGNKPANSSDGNRVVSADAVALGVAYVEMDSVLLNFDMFSDKSEELLAKRTAAENRLNAQGNAYQKKRHGLPGQGQQRSRNPRTGNGNGGGAL